MSKCINNLNEDSDFSVKDINSESDIGLINNSQEIKEEDSNVSKPKNINQSSNNINLSIISYELDTLNNTLTNLSKKI